MIYALVSKANAEFFRFNCQHECNPLEKLGDKHTCAFENGSIKEKNCLENLNK